MSMPSARGGRKPSAPLDLEVIRELKTGDLETILTSPKAGTGVTLAAIRHGHHLLAQALAKGCKPGEASLITGYSPSRISILQSDPAFAELISHYKSLVDERFTEVAERMKALGLSAMDELQERLEVNPEGFTNREMMELTELMLVKPGNGGGGRAPTGTLPMIAVQFVSAPGVTIEGKAE